MYCKGIPKSLSRRIKKQKKAININLKVRKK